MSLERLWVIGKEGVDQTKQLHDSLILTQILVPLQEEHKLPTIAPWRGAGKTLLSKFHTRSFGYKGTSIGP